MRSSEFGFLGAAGGRASVAEEYQLRPDDDEQKLLESPCAVRFAFSLLDPYFLSRAAFRSQHDVVKKLDRQNKKVGTCE